MNETQGGGTAVAWIAALAAICAAAIGIIPDLLPKKPQPPSDAEPIEPDVAEVEILAAAAGDPRCTAILSEFGVWQKSYEDDGAQRDYQRGQRYIAPEDGFVSAVSGGTNPAKGVVIRVAEAGSNDFSIRFRSIHSYAGGVVPIAKNQKWYVAAESGGGNISIYWAPLRYVRVRPDRTACSS